MTTFNIIFLEITDFLFYQVEGIPSLSFLYVVTQDSVPAYQP
jgi:hypothetical protein